MQNKINTEEFDISKITQVDLMKFCITQGVICILPIYILQKDERKRKGEKRIMRTHE